MMTITAGGVPVDAEFERQMNRKIEAARRGEVERLAKKIYVAIFASPADLGPLQGVAEAAFKAADEFMLVQEKRRRPPLRSRPT